MTWSENAVDQLVVGNPQAQHVYIGPGDANGNEGVFLYGPDGVTVLAAFDIKNDQGIITGGTVQTAAAGQRAVMAGSGLAYYDAQATEQLRLYTDYFNQGGNHQRGIIAFGPDKSASPYIAYNDATGYQGGALTLIYPGGSELDVGGPSGGITVWGGMHEGEFRSGRATRSGTSDNFSAGSMAGLGSVSLPANAPAGAYAVSLSCPLSSTSACTAYRRLIAPNGANLTADDTEAFLANTRYPYNWSDVYQHAGGAGAFSAYAQVSAGTGAVYNTPWHLAVAYLGS